jgi:hypothetical protein
MSIARPWNEPTLLKWKIWIGTRCVFCLCVFGSLIMAAWKVMHFKIRDQLDHYIFFHDLKLIIFQHRKYIVITCLATRGVCVVLPCVYQHFFWGVEFGAMNIYIILNITFFKERVTQKKDISWKSLHFYIFFKQVATIKTWFHCWAIPTHG